MSLAKILDAPLILAAIAVAPHPLPRSSTDLPLTVSGLSKRYLNWKEEKTAKSDGERLVRGIQKRKGQVSWYTPVILALSSRISSLRPAWAT
jgi:hypothetical protein